LVDLTSLMPSGSIYGSPPHLRALHEVPDWIAAGNASRSPGGKGYRTFLIAPHDFDATAPSAAYARLAEQAEYPASKISGRSSFAMARTRS
jgi:hypothetical protein